MTSKGLITHRYIKYLFNPGNVVYKAVIKCQEATCAQLG